MSDLMPYAFLRKYAQGGSNLFEGLITVSIPAGYKLDGYLENDPSRDDSYGGAYTVPSPDPGDTRKVTVRVSQFAGQPASVQNFTIPGHAQAAGITKIEIHVSDLTPNLPVAKDKRKGKVVVIYSQADDRMAT